MYTLLTKPTGECFYFHYLPKLYFGFNYINMDIYFIFCNYLHPILILKHKFMNYQHYCFSIIIHKNVDELHEDIMDGQLGIQ